MAVSEVPDRPNLEHVKKMAKALHRAAGAGDPQALERIRAVSDTVTLSSAQAALAHEHGFPHWAAFRAEIERRAAGQV